MNQDDKPIPPPDTSTGKDPLIAALEREEERVKAKYEKQMAKHGPKAKARKAKTSKTSQNRIRIIKRQREALELRLAGHSLADIAVHLKYAGQQGAAAAIEAALKLTLNETADDVRKLELARLDAMYVKQYEAAVNGDPYALNAALNIMNRRAKYLGLDAPQKQEVTGKDGQPLPATPVFVPPSKEEVEAHVKAVMDKMRAEF